jgi:predicted nucleotidyltransferase
MTVATGHHLDARTERFVSDVLAAIDSHVPIVEAFLLGSGAAGGFDPATSDVDVTVVVERPTGDDRAALVEAVAAIDVPVRSLELVLYVEGRQPPDYELNLNEGEERNFEQPFWFVLDAAKAQDQAVPMWGRCAWSELFDAIPRERIGQAVQESLEWALRQPPEDEFARGHVVRSRHYLEHGEWITKQEASA